MGACLLLAVSCRTIPDVQRVAFELTASFDKSVLYLDTEDKGVVTIQLTSDDEVSQEAAYKLVSFSCPEGSLLIDKKGNPVAAGMPMGVGENTFYYQPGTAGVHTLDLSVADTWGDSTQHCTLKVDVAHHQVVDFAFTASFEKPVIYLDTEDKALITIQITPAEEVSGESTYKVVSFCCPEGGSFTDEKGEPVAAGMPLSSGETTFVYQPGTVGEHTLEFSVADTWGDSTQHCTLTVDAAHHQVVDFQASLRPEAVQVLTCQQGRMRLTISSEDPRARHLHYTLQSIHTTSGTCFLADGLTELVAGSTLPFGGQELVFVPDREAAGPEEIVVVVRNEKGDESTARTTLQLQPGTWQASVQGQLVGREGQVSLALTIEAREQGLQTEVWQLTGWQLSGGLTGVLQDHQQRQLPAYPLRHGNSHFTLMLPPFTLTALPRLTLSVTGPGGRVQEVVFPLVEQCSQLLARQLSELPREMTEVARKSLEALQGVPGEAALRSSYETQTACSRQLTRALQSVQDNLAVLGEGPATAGARRALQRLQRGAQKEMNDALAQVAQQLSYFDRLTRGINETDRYGDLPLHDAVAASDLPLLRFLLPRTNHINLENHEGQTPLDKAVAHGDIACLLQRHGAGPGIDSLVRARFRRGVNEYKNKVTPLLRAVIDGDEEGVRLLLRHPALLIDKGERTSKGTEGETALMKAAEEGHLSIVRLLVSHGAEVNMNHYTTTILCQLGRKYKYRQGSLPTTYKHHERTNTTALLQAYRGRRWCNSSARRQIYLEIEDYLKRQGARNIAGWETYYDKAYFQSGLWKRDRDQDRPSEGSCPSGRVVLRD